MSSPSTSRRPSGSRSLKFCAHASSTSGPASGLIPSAITAVNTRLASRHREVSAIAAGYFGASRSSSFSSVDTRVLAGCSRSVASRKRRKSRTVSTPCSASSQTSTCRGTTYVMSRSWTSPLRHRVGSGRSRKSARDRSRMAIRSRHTRPASPAGTRPCSAAQAVNSSMIRCSNRDDTGRPYARLSASGWSGQLGPTPGRNQRASPGANAAPLGDPRR